MSLLDKAIAAITPPVSDEKRAEAHANARAAAEPGDWLSQVLDHHEEIDQAFAETRAAATADARRQAQRKLGALLTGHSMAEEAVIYPALAQAGKQGHANTAYTEQVAAKQQVAALEMMDPMSEDYLDKLGHLEGAVKTHVYQEESDWFIDMKREAPAEAQAHATARYREEAGRYLEGGPPMVGVAPEARSFASEAAAEAYQKPLG
ncbi:hemerythrin domain-containing protein [uncultured Phenylobacterium sp.]|uniref:hemerythrin domain-containing protein n=1 Tax=uncultured Phenylobacterium sp. TaxID=349273 RepID=UPI0025E99CB3|nr:hemerythrin domain-containing protein [uncultured Phenylobacterium sp.]